MGWIVVAISGGAGCKMTREAMSDVDRRCFWMSWEVAESQFETLNRNYLTGVMNDPESSDETKRWAAVRMIARFVRPGFSSADFGELFDRTRWLDGAEIQIVGGIGGWVPVELPAGADFLVFSLIPNGQDRGGNPVDGVYFVLAGVDSNPDRHDLAGRFLRGELDDGRVALQEFAICYRDHESRLCVRYTRRGLALYGDEVVFPSPKNDSGNSVKTPGGDAPLLDAMGNPILQ